MLAWGILALCYVVINYAMSRDKITFGMAELNFQLNKIESWEKFCYDWTFRLFFLLSPSFILLWDIGILRGIDQLCIIVMYLNNYYVVISSIINILTLDINIDSVFSYGFFSALLPPLLIGKIEKTAETLCLCIVLKK